MKVLPWTPNKMIAAAKYIEKIMNDQKENY